MQSIKKRFIQVMHADQQYHVSKILVTTCCQFELNQLRQGHHIGILDFLADCLWVWKRDGSRFAASWESARNQKVDRNLTTLLDKTPRPTGHRVVGFSYISLPTEVQPLLSDQHI